MLCFQCLFYRLSPKPIMPYLRGGYFVRFCVSLNEWPSAVLCVILSILQMAVLDYYVVKHLGNVHLTWIALDAVNTTVLVITIHQARLVIRQKSQNGSGRGSGSGSMGWIAWLCMSASVAAKTVFIFHKFSHRLNERSSSFFGPNTLKTTVALGSCTFLLLLITQHDAPPGSEGRQYIDELTGNVFFDILDTVDILEVLFDSEERRHLWTGMKEVILSVATLNLLLPTVTLYFLHRSKFGQKPLSAGAILGHHLFLVLAVNVPSLVVRVFLWQGISAGVSPFTLKNLVEILRTCFEIYEPKRERYLKRLEEMTSDAESARERDGPDRLWGRAPESKTSQRSTRNSQVPVDSDNRSNQGLVDSDSRRSYQEQPQVFVCLDDIKEYGAIYR